MRIFILCLLLLSGWSPLQADDLGARPSRIRFRTGGRPLTRSIASWRDLQRQNVVIQKHDYSCGAAALATIFQYYFQDNVSEKTVLDAIFARLERLSSPKREEEIQDRFDNGLSIQDLNETAKELGYIAAPVKLPDPISQVKQLKAPVIVRLQTKDPEFLHFVVLRGIVGKRVFLADPIRGNIELSMKEFVEQWNEVVLALDKQGFGLPKNHPLAIRAEELAPKLDFPARRAILRSTDR